MKAYFKSLFEYNTWANNRVIGALEHQNVNDPFILRLAGHLIAAQQIWLHRIKGIAPPSMALWGEYTLETIKAESVKSDNDWKRFFDRVEDLGRVIHYRNTAGLPFSSSAEVIITHVLHHGSYHRGQVAMMMRRSGYEPVDTDYIIWSRVVSGQLSL